MGCWRLAVGALIAQGWNAVSLGDGEDGVAGGEGSG